MQVAGTSDAAAGHPSRYDPVTDTVTHASVTARHRVTHSVIRERTISSDGATGAKGNTRKAAAPATGRLLDGREGFECSTAGNPAMHWRALMVRTNASVGEEDPVAACQSVHPLVGARMQHAETIDWTDRIGGPRWACQSSGQLQHLETVAQPLLWHMASRIQRYQGGYSVSRAQCAACCCRLCARASTSCCSSNSCRSVSLFRRYEAVSCGAATSQRGARQPGIASGVGERPQFVVGLIRAASHHGSAGKMSLRAALLVSGLSCISLLLSYRKC